MGMLDGRNALVFGLSNDRSIGWGISQALHREGANLAFGYAGAAIEKRMRPLAERLDAKLIAECDVTSDEQIDSFFAQAKDVFPKVDIVIHSLAFAPAETFENRFVDTSRESFRISHDVSAYSLIALARAARPLMTDGGSILTLTYFGAEKAVTSYKIMGVAKASLEASVRYLADDLGPEGIRVNAISAGPIRTLAASGIKGFRDSLKSFAATSPLRRNVTIEEVGATAAFLVSDGAAGITGEVVHVDAGFNIVGMKTEDE